MQIYLRYAANTNYLPNPFPTKAYDERMLYVLSGRGEIRFADRTVPLERNVLCYYPTGTEYYPVSDPADPLTFVTLNFDFSRKYEAYTKCTGTVPSTEYRPELAYRTHEDCGYALFQTHFVLKNAWRFRDSILRIAEEFSRKMPYAQELAASLLQTVCYELLDDSGDARQTLCRRVTEYLEQHFSEPIDNRSVAQALNYHPNYLNTVFRENMGITLHRYQMQLRLEKAAALLLNSDRSVTEIAAEVGFENSDHFSRRFTEQYGISPTRYRRRAILV